MAMAPVNNQPLSLTDTHKSTFVQKEYLAENFNMDYLDPFNLATDVYAVIKAGWKIPIIKTPEEFWKESLSVKNNKNCKLYADGFSKCTMDNIRENRAMFVAEDFVKCLNRMSVVRKPNKDRLCLDSSEHLNTRIETPKFSHVTNQEHFKCFRKGIWMAKIDLKNGYLHIPVHPDFWPYLCYRFEDKFVCFKYMIFGINLAPLVFQRIMNVLLEPLMREGIICLSYLDDIWIQGDTPSECRKAIKKVVDHLNNMNFTINYAKSVLEPTQSMDYLGIHYDSKLGIMTPQQEKVDKILTHIADLLAHPNKESFSSLAGKLQDISHVFPQGKPFLSNIYANYSRKDSVPNVLTYAAESELKWWRDNLISKATLRKELRPITHVWKCDASEYGIGCHDHFDTQKVYSRKFTAAESAIHNNEREFEAVIIMLTESPFISEFKGGHLHLLSDNSSGAAAINRGYSKAPNLNKQRKLLWEIQDKLDLQMSSSFIPGELNVLADALSRGLPYEHLQYQSTTSNCLVNPNRIGEEAQQTSTPASKLRSSKYLPRDVAAANLQSPLFLCIQALLGTPTIPGFAESEHKKWEETRSYFRDRSRFTNKLGNITLLSPDPIEILQEVHKYNKKQSQQHNNFPAHYCHWLAQNLLRLKLSVNLHLSSLILLLNQTLAVLHRLQHSIVANCGFCLIRNNEPSSYNICAWQSQLGQMPKTSKKNNGATTESITIQTKPFSSRSNPQTRKPVPPKVAVTVTEKGPPTASSNKGYQGSSQAYQSKPGKGFPRNNNNSSKNGYGRKNWKSKSEHFTDLVTLSYTDPEVAIPIQYVDNFAKQASEPNKVQLEIQAGWPATATPTNNDLLPNTDLVGFAFRHPLRAAILYDHNSSGQGFQ